MNAAKATLQNMTVTNLASLAPDFYTFLKKFQYSNSAELDTAASRLLANAPAVTVSGSASDDSVGKIGFAQAALQLQFKYGALVAELGGLPAHGAIRFTVPLVKAANARIATGTTATNKNNVYNIVTSPGSTGFKLGALINIGIDFDPTKMVAIDLELSMSLTIKSASEWRIDALVFDPVIDINKQDALGIAIAEVARKLWNALAAAAAPWASVLYGIPLGLTVPPTAFTPLTEENLRAWAFGVAAVPEMLTGTETVDGLILAETPSVYAASMSSAVASIRSNFLSYGTTSEIGEVSLFRVFWINSDSLPSYTGAFRSGLKGALGYCYCPAFKYFKNYAVSYPLVPSPLSIGFSAYARIQFSSEASLMFGSGPFQDGVFANYIST
jgi:hypothetical protein